MSGRKRSLPREVFLSHASSNRRVAQRITELLRSSDIPVWYSATHIVGAQQWHDEIGQALERCDWFVVLLSPASVKPQWVKRELLYALNRSQYANRIVPVKLKECDWSALSWTLETIQMVDCTTSFDAGCRDLLRVWGLKHTPARYAAAHN